MNEFLASGRLSEWFHVVAALFLAGMIYSQMYLLRLPPTIEAMRLVKRANTFNVSAVVLTLTSGCARVYRSPKGVAWYLHNGYFHASLAIFAIIMVWTVITTVRIVRWDALFKAGGTPDATLWNRTGKISNAQPPLLVVITLLMTLMAHAA